MQQMAVWTSFYVLIGTAAAALTGLTFVVTTLLAQRQLAAPSEAFGVFNTPSVVHFCAALGVAAMLCAPWPFLWQPDLLLGLGGVGGLLYMRNVVRRARRQQDYTPVLEDLLFHLLFPVLAYGALVVGALVGVANATPALFVTGVTTLVLLFIGIHNAWDNVTYLIFSNPSPKQTDHNAGHEVDAAARQEADMVFKEAMARIEADHQAWLREHGMAPDARDKGRPRSLPADDQVPE